MLSSLLRGGSLVTKRLATEYVIARRINGQLVEAEFDRDDKDFSYNPRLTAQGMSQDSKWSIDYSVIL